MLTKKRWSFPLLLVAFLMALLPLGMLRAQTGTENIVLSLAVPEYMSSNFPPDTFTQFETDHPGVKVNIVKDLQQGGFAYGDPDQYFSDLAGYVGKADVLYISDYSLGVEGTRAGYFLDLAPLVRGDTTFNADDFVPAAWQAYQWDGGIWALPVALNILILSYDPAAFDKAGVPYPSGKWTIDDLADAARKLTIKDASGKVTRPGVLMYNMGPFFVSAMGDTLYDSSVSPNPPLFDKPGLAHILDVWSELQTEVGGGFDDYMAIPLRMDQAPGIAKNMGNTERPRSGSLFPGGKAGLSVEGFAVSGGTQYPELAYALTKYISSSAQIASRFFGLEPARKSLQNLPPSDDMPTFKPQFTPENQAVVDEALANALPPSEYRFWQYLNNALADMQSNKVDAKTALQNSQVKALTMLQAAAAHRKTLALTVATPIPTPVLKSGELSIKFDLVAYISPLPNRDQWDKVIKEFTENDPQIRYISFDSGFGGDMNSLTDQFDCFALPYNVVDYLTQDKLLNLDPLITADASFDKKDVLGNALSQLQRGDKTLGFPLYIQPEVLRYNTDVFAKAGVQSPERGWDISAFNDTLKALKRQPDDPIPFIPSQFGASYLLMLTAAYGGIPLDYRTQPPTINFTDPAVVDAMRQVLDLAKNGYIKYQKLATNGGGGGGSWPRTDPIYTSSLGMMNFYSSGLGNTEKDPYQTISYPKGTKITPLAYGVGAAYISSKAANPEACYRWISTLSKHPELFWAMPARRSLIDSPGVTAQGADVAAFYTTYEKLMQDPSAVNIPTQTTSAGDYVLGFFLNRVFDRYVLENADLDAELKQAEMYARGYQECIAKIPSEVPTNPKESAAYYQQFTDCAIKLDPSLKSLFNPGQ